LADTCGILVYRLGRHVAHRGAGPRRDCLLLKSFDLHVGSIAHAELRRIKQFLAHAHGENATAGGHRIGAEVDPVDHTFDLELLEASQLLSHSGRNVNDGQAGRSLGPEVAHLSSECRGTSHSNEIIAYGEPQAPPAESPAPVCDRPRLACKAIKPSLANAARMVEDNPPLLRLRLLQQVGATSGNSVVLGNTATLPVAKRERRAGEGQEEPALRRQPELTQVSAEWRGIVDAFRTDAAPTASGSSWLKSTNDIAQNHQP